MGSFEKNNQRYTITCESKDETPMVCFWEGETSVSCPLLLACKHCTTLFDMFFDVAEGRELVAEQTTTLPLKYNAISMKLFVDFMVHYDSKSEDEIWNVEKSKVTAVKLLHSFFQDYVTPADNRRWQEHVKEHPEDAKPGSDGNWPESKPPQAYPQYYLTDFINLAMFYNFDAAIEAACFHYANEFIVGKTTEEIRSALHVHNDMTEEDEKELDAMFERFKKEQQEVEEMED